MRLTEIEQYIISLFDTRDNSHFYEESGMTARCKEGIKRIGYCTNLTLDTIEEARKSRIGIRILR